MSSAGKTGPPPGGHATHGAAESAIGLNPLDGEFVSMLGLLLDGSSALVGIKDAEGYYLFANRALERLVGMQPGLLRGQRDAQFMPVESASAVEAREREVLTRGVPIQADEELYIHGSCIPCVTVRFPYRSMDGRPLGVGFVAIDVGAQRARTTEALDALHRAEQVIDELRGAIAELQTRASTDRLTGLWNRTRIEEAARHEIARFARYGDPVSLMFIDLDHFKRINDGHGHLVGDAVLCQFAKVVRGRMRSTDMLGRWGGEEFVMLCPHTSLPSARILAHRVREGLSTHRFDTVGQVTASIGVAQCFDTESFEQWLGRADGAAYRAKASGRDRVVVDVHPEGQVSTPQRADGGFVRLVWRKSYECGHASIDRQHRELFEQANDLIGSIVRDAPHEEVLANLDLLVEAVKRHFADEERILSASRYPHIEAHSRSHSGLLGVAANLLGAVARGETKLAELLHFLAYELVASHMLGEDRKFFPHVEALPD